MVTVVARDLLFRRHYEGLGVCTIPCLTLVRPLVWVAVVDVSPCTCGLAMAEEAETIGGGTLLGEVGCGCISFIPVSKAMMTNAAASGSSSGRT